MPADSKANAGGLKGGYKQAGALPRGQPLEAPQESPEPGLSESPGIKQIGAEMSPEKHFSAQAVPGVLTPRGSVGHPSNFSGPPAAGGMSHTWGGPQTWGGPPGSLRCQVFGFAIEPESRSSMAWGGTEAYAKLRQRWPTSLTAQIRDYESMFWTLGMEERGEAGTGRAVRTGDLYQKEGESDRDYGRRLFKESMLLDLRQASSADEESPKMDWDLGDLGWKHQVRMVNWPEEFSAVKEQPRARFKISAKALGVIVPLLKKKYQLEQPTDSDDEDTEETLGETAPRIESWSESEKALSEQAQGQLSVLVTSGGTVLQHVSDGKKYNAHLEAQKNKEEKRQARKALKATKKTQATRTATKSHKADAGKARDHSGTAPTTDDDDDDDDDEDGPTEDHDAVATTKPPKGGAAAARPIVPLPRAPPSRVRAGSPTSKHGALAAGYGAQALAGVAPSHGASSSKRTLDEETDGRASRFATTLNYIRTANEEGGVGEESGAGEERVAKRIKLAHSQAVPATQTVGVLKRKRSGEDTVEPRRVEPHRAVSVWPPAQIADAEPEISPLVQLSRRLDTPTHFYDRAGVLRESAPAGTPAKRVEGWMTGAYQLAHCWTNMPGAHIAGEKRCRYVLPDGSKSQVFFASSVVPRGDDHPSIDDDESAGCLEMSHRREWVGVSADKVAIVVPRHLRYHDALYEAFFTAVD
ncbi:hypothetical protein B0H12DRAFT_1280464 [Mycena haematopus]|nr:hypothetical protein B0H12DRAFT_1280464 [Mycena haematopus]